MNPHLQAALPFLISAVATLVSAPFINAIISFSIRRVTDSNPPKFNQGGYLPDDQQYVALWSVDQFQILTAFVLTPFIGIVSSEKIKGHVGWLVGTFLIVEAILAIDFGYVASRRKLAKYSSDASLARAKFVEHEIRGRGFIGATARGVASISYATVICAVSMLIAAGIAALLA